MEYVLNLELESGSQQDLQTIMRGHKCDIGEALGRALSDTAYLYEAVANGEEVYLQDQIRRSISIFGFEIVLPGYRTRMRRVVLPRSPA